MTDLPKDISERVKALEAALDQSAASLEKRIADESSQRKEALFRQEHRLVGALWNVYDNWGNGRLFWASVCGFASAFISRTALTAAVGGGLVAGVVASLLALQANYLLRVQNEKMDIQTFVMDAQRRTQLFQAEFSAIASDVSAWIDKDKQSARQEAGASLDYTLSQCVSGAAEVPEIAEDSTYARIRELNELSGVSFFDRAAAMSNISDKLAEIDTDPARRALSICRGRLIERLAGTTQYLGLEQFRKNLAYRLNPALASRIAALSSALRPYSALEERYRTAARGEWPPIARLTTWLFEGTDSGEAIPEARLNRQVVSAERAQLYLFLANQEVYIDDVLNAGADFSQTNLSRRVLNSMAIRDMPRSILNSAVLTEVLMAGDLDGVDFHCADVRYSFVGRASFKEANFSDSRFYESRISLWSLAYNELSKARFEAVQVTDVPPDLMEDRAMALLDDLIQDRWNSLPKPARTTYGNKVVVVRNGAAYQLEDRRTTDDVPNSPCLERPR